MSNDGELDAAEKTEFVLSPGVLQTDLGVLRHLPQVKVVVTGDSLSYNRYDYDPIARTSALAGKHGYQSWSWLLRDAFLRNLPGFAAAEEFVAASDNTAEVSQDRTLLEPYLLPIGNKCMKLKFVEQGCRAAFFIPCLANPRSAGREKDELYLYFATHVQSGGSYRVSVFDAESEVSADHLKNHDRDTLGEPVVIDNRGKLGRYQGVEMLSALICDEAKPQLLKVVIEALSFADGQSGCELCIIGSAASKLDWENTGRGSTTSAWLSDNVDVLVNEHDPNLTIIITGANDSGELTAKDTYNNAKKIIQAIHARTQSTILLVTQPPSSDITDERSYPYADALKRAAAELSCGIVDLFEVLRPFPASLWRFDNVHFNRWGNQVVFENIVRLYFPSLDIRKVNHYE